MTKENAIKGNSLVMQIKAIKDSQTFLICERILKEDYPYLFGHSHMSNRDSKVTIKSDTTPFTTKEEKDEITNEYTRFIEQVQKLMNKKIARLEKELADLRAE